MHAVWHVGTTTHNLGGEQVARKMGGRCVGRLRVEILTQRRLPTFTTHSALALLKCCSSSFRHFVVGFVLVGEAETEQLHSALSMTERKGRRLTQRVHGRWRRAGECDGLFTPPQPFALSPHSFAALRFGCALREACSLATSSTREHSDKGGFCASSSAQRAYRHICRCVCVCAHRAA